MALLPLVINRAFFFVQTTVGYICTCSNGRRFSYRRAMIISAFSCVRNRLEAVPEMSKIAMLVSAFKSIDRGSSKQKLPRDPPLLLCVHRACRNIGRQNKLPFLAVSLHYRSRNAVLNAVRCENQYHYYCLDYYFFFVRLLYVYRTCV